MKLIFICIGKSEEQTQHGVSLYSYKFAIKKVSDEPLVQKTFADLVVKTFEQSHYKIGTEYTVLISDTLTLVTGLNKAGQN